MSAEGKGSLIAEASELIAILTAIVRKSREHK